MRRADLAALIHGATELLPVSSSAHAQLLGSREQATGLHAGSAAALVIGLHEEARQVLGRLSARRVGMHVLAGAIPSVVGVRLGARASTPVPGLVAGAAALAWADRVPGNRSRWDAGPADGLWLGVAQALALVPGVSRNGATLVAARILGFSVREGNALSREVGLPVTLGAVAVGGRVEARSFALSFVSTLLSLPLLRLVDRGPLWPWALYRCALALELIRRGRR